MTYHHCKGNDPLESLKLRVFPVKGGRDCDHSRLAVDLEVGHIICNQETQGGATL